MPVSVVVKVDIGRVIVLNLLVGVVAVVGPLLDMAVAHVPDPLLADAVAHRPEDPAEARPPGDADHVPLEARDATPDPPGNTPHPEGLSLTRGTGNARGHDLGSVVLLIAVNVQGLPPPLKTLKILATIRRKPITIQGLMLMVGMSKPFGVIGIPL